MISEKMTELGKNSSVIREIFEYGRKRKAEIGAENVFDFSLGNPSVPAPACVSEILKELIDMVPAQELHGYTSGPGDFDVRTKIAEYITSSFGCEASAADIYMTCGAAASLAISLHAVINPGDEVIAFAPFFPEYRVFSEKAGAKLVVVNCREDNLQIDFDAFKAALSPKTKAVIVNSPNNPSGVIIPKSDIIKLADLLNKAQSEFGTDIYLFADEPYRELVFSGEKVPYIPCYYDNTVVCYSFSKSLSLPGERIGYIFVSPKTAGHGDLYAAVCGAGRALGYVCAPALMQYTVARCLGQTSDMDFYKRNRELLYTALTDIGYDVIKPDGAFYMFVRALENDACAFCENAKKYELLLVPSNDFACPGFIRIAYCVDTDIITRSIPSFKALFEEYNK